MFNAIIESTSSVSPRPGTTLTVSRFLVSVLLGTTSLIALDHGRLQPALTGWITVELRWLPSRGSTCGQSPRSATCRQRSSTSAHVTTGEFKAIVTVIYRPGSDAVEQRFFDELSSLLDVLASFQEPVFIVGDFNVRFERAADPVQRQFNELLASRGLSVRPAVPTRRDGCTIDAVIIREDMLDCASLSPSCLDVTVLDVGLSDHHMLTWSVNAHQTQRQPLQTVITRPWRSLDVEQLRSEILASPLCQVDSWPSDVDEMATMYDSVLKSILDRLIPQRTIVRWPRPSDPWFDSDCRQAKRVTRRLERA